MREAGQEAEGGAPQRPERKTGLPPVVRPDARLLILGSLPGEASLAARRYYAHPRNQFWRLLGEAIGEDLHARNYEGRLDRLLRRRIGLWDVVASALRPGSLDGAIRGAAHNPLRDLAARLPDLRAIAFNGQTASRAGRLLLETSGLVLIDLPSSSPANTAPFAAKLARWSELRAWAGPAARFRA
jgi:double-stranded uracil-DNA glycosylase